MTEKTYAVVLQACFIIDAMIGICSCPKVVMVSCVGLTLEFGWCQEGRRKESIRDDIVPFLPPLSDLFMLHLRGRFGLPSSQPGFDEWSHERD